MDKPVWYAERSDVVAILNNENFGPVTVTWSFTPLAVP